jgi:transcription elongation factor GreA
MIFYIEVGLMARNVTLSKPMFENLVLHLVNIENEKEGLIEGFFPKPSMGRLKLRSFLDDYITGIDFLIKNKVSVVDKSDNSFPFVIIYCKTEVLDLKTREKLQYRIVSPYDNLKTGDVSFLSPVGKSLLMKEVGDEVTIDAPGGKLNYKIQSINLTAMQHA